MSAPTYDAYRDSGVATLGAVPSHWRVAPAKYALAARSGGASIKGQCADAPDDGLFQGYSASGPDVWLTDYEFDGPGLVLSAVGARCGKVFLATGKWGVVANTHCLLPTDANVAKFLWYLTNNEAWWEKGGTAQPFVKVPDSLARKIGLPPPAEQAAIAAFLDRETGKIDALVEAQTRLIELLKEKRQAVISHAVTKGLDPDAPMKDSGVEWLGQVPAHWEVGKLGYFSKLQGGYAFSSELFGSDGVSVVRMNNLNRGRLDLNEAAKIPEEESLERVALLPGDLLWGMSGSIGETGSLGNFARVAEHDMPCQLNQRVGRFLTNARKLRVDFLEIIIQSRQFNEQVLNFVTGTAQFNISSEQVQSCAVALPSIEEQAKIVTESSGRMRHLNGLIETATDAIALLQERRAALISAAVTGKIDVRGLAPAQAEAA